MYHPNDVDNINMDLQILRRLYKLRVEFWSKAILDGELPDDFDMSLLSNSGVYDGKIDIDKLIQENPRDVHDIYVGRSSAIIQVLVVKKNLGIKKQMLRDIKLDKCLVEVAKLREILTEIYNAPGMPGYVMAETSYTKHK